MVQHRDLPGHKYATENSPKKKPPRSLAKCEGKGQESQLRMEIFIYLI